VDESDTSSVIGNLGIFGGRANAAKISNKAAGGDAFVFDSKYSTQIYINTQKDTYLGRDPKKVASVKEFHGETR
jgi:hypothetical protein